MATLTKLVKLVRANPLIMWVGAALLLAFVMLMLAVIGTLV